MKVVIIGNIGSGKTTLADSLSLKIQNSIVIKEPVEEWRESGILAAYYKALLLPAKSHERILFEWFFQTKVLVDRLAEMRKVWANLNPRERKSVLLIYDGHPIADKVFTEGYGEIPDTQMRLWYDSVYDKVQMTEDCSPDLLIYIATPPRACSHQINNRGRSEEDTIPFEYLQRLDNSFMTVFQTATVSQKMMFNRNGNMTSEEIRDAVYKFITEEFIDDDDELIQSVNFIIREDSDDSNL